MAVIARPGRERGSIKAKESLITTLESQNEKPKQKITAINREENEDQELELMVKKPFKCVMCGTRYSKQQGNFSFSQSPFFKGNNSHLPICIKCLEDITDQYQKILGSQDDAIKRVCMHWDLYLSDSILQSSRKIDAHRSRIKEYVRQCNLSQNAGKTYDDYLLEIHNSVMLSTEDVLNMEESEAKKLQRSIDKWGIGFSEQDYKNLDDHYKMLKKNNPNCDSNQEIFIKSLCNLDMLSKRALKEGDSDKYMKLTEQYSKTFTKAGLKTIQEIDNSADETLGVTLATISQFTPEEYYKDKNLYKDFDGLGDYFERFVKRPLKNLMTGSTDRDHEYYVKDSKNGDSDE